MQIKKANGKKNIVMSRKEWQLIGKKAGWGEGVSRGTYEEESDLTDPMDLLKEEEKTESDLEWMSKHPEDFKDDKPGEEKRWYEKNHPLTALIRGEYGQKTYKALIEKAFSMTNMDGTTQFNPGSLDDLDELRGVIEEITGHYPPVRIRSKSEKERFIQECFAIIRRGLEAALTSHEGVEIPPEEYKIREIYEGKDPRRTY